MLHVGPDMSRMAIDDTVPSAGSFGRPVVLSGVQCVGDETSLSMCPSASTISQCSHTNDVGIRCSKSTMNLKKIF